MSTTRPARACRYSPDDHPRAVCFLLPPLHSPEAASGPALKEELISPVVPVVIVDVGRKLKELKCKCNSQA